MWFLLTVALSRKLPQELYPWLVMLPQRSKPLPLLRVINPEFIPSALQKPLLSDNAGTSYAEVAAGCSGENMRPSTDTDVYATLCPYFMNGECPYGEECMFVHGNACDLCGHFVLVPGDEAQNTQHRRGSEKAFVKECLEEHEKQMEVAFTMARSKGMQCGICMEVVMDKPNEYARRFGILPNCKHCFCLECLRKWRQAKQFDTKNIRSCPECRVMSDFVIPSTFWVETDEEKACLTEVYKASMKSKNCKYFANGDGECPFGNKCFYRHVRPDGVVVEGDSPRTVRRRMRRNNHRSAHGYGPSGDLSLLWDFLEERDHAFDGGSDSSWLWDLRVEDELDVLSLDDSDSDSEFGFWDLLWY
ncbi:unnamed protein product [Soboliphyme baturini]|uniref:RING-type E3 ubiquitin transferase n=1 Tax=Soboliphyme baturini TaxID=241478 RepID=A0A183IWG1_9BILA|nr:unnamed protein product [Soboliphyme baturini]